MSEVPRIFVSAGEVSGDRMLGDILSHVRERFPGMRLRGLGGARARVRGLEPLFPIADTAFSGVWDVIGNAFFALRMFRRAVSELERFRPHLALLVDYPGLNLRLARVARNLGVPVCFVAPPQAWAYRDPARKLRRAVSALRGCHVHALFPFEAEPFRASASDVTVGHFFVASEGNIRVTGSGAPGTRLLLCPGSRLPVLRRNLPAWLDLLRRAGCREAVSVLVPTHLADAAERLAAAHAAGGAPAEAQPRMDIRVDIRTDKAAAFAEARHAIAFPGTITLELALARIPTLVLAILDPLTLALGRRLLAGPRLALPNLLAEEDVFPEWAGSGKGPTLARYLELERLRDGIAGWGPRLEQWAARMGPGAGAETAGNACVTLLERSLRREKAQAPQEMGKLPSG